MNKIELEDINFPWSADAVRFMQNAYGEILENIGTALGHNAVLYGVEHSGSYATVGAVVVDGEIIPFESGLWTEGKFTIVETSQSVIYADQVQREAFFTRVARCSASGEYDLSNFPRLGNLPVKYAPIDWTSVTFDDAVTGVAGAENTILHSGLEDGVLKAYRDESGNVTLHGGGKFRPNTSDAYILATLPESFRPKGTRIIPVTVFHMPHQETNRTVVAYATVMASGAIIIPACIAQPNNGNTNYIPYFNSTFSID